MGKAEWWVMRLLRIEDPITARLRPAYRRDFVGAERAKLDEAVVDGKLCLTPNGELHEPVEVFETQERATEHALQLQANHPAEAYTVFLSMDLRGV